MKNYVLLTSREWNRDIHSLLSQRKEEKWWLIENENDFTYVKLRKINPDIIFIPHWSQIIGENIYKNFVCILFHMTDLPYGRGGSPLQNLIVRGHKSTMISALKVDSGIDTGPIYLKKELILDGTALNIFSRASRIIHLMIEQIIDEKLEPVTQVGTVVNFKRRNSTDSDLARLTDLESIYDYIRMLDAPGYPSAYIELESFKFEFFNVSKENDELISNVRIIKK